VIVALAGAIAWWRGLFGPGFVEYRVPVATDIPTAIAVAPDGTVWFTIEFADAIGRLRNGTIERIPKGKQNVEPMGLAVAPDGGVWYTDNRIRAISRMAPDGRITSFTVSTPIARLNRLAIAPDGAVWFADATAFSITRLKDGVFTPHVMPSFRPTPFGVAVDRDGTVWATLQGANKLARIAPGGEVTEIDIPTRASGPSDIAIDQGGAVWFLEFRGNKIGRYAAGRFTEFAVPSPRAGLAGLAVAPDGAVWFGELRAHRLARLREGVIKEFALPRGDARPFGVAVDVAGNVWYADLGGWLGTLPAARGQGR
jgi:virginiamycin B lyase